MKLNELIEVLNGMGAIAIELPNGEMVKPHFHLSELTGLTKKSIDCGGKLHEEKTISLQLW